MDIPILKPFKLRTMQMRKEQEFHRLLPYTLDFVLAGPQNRAITKDVNDGQQRRSTWNEGNQMQREG